MYTNQEWLYIQSEHKCTHKLGLIAYFILKYRIHTYWEWLIFNINIYVNTNWDWLPILAYAKQQWFTIVLIKKIYGKSRQWHWEEQKSIVDKAYILYVGRQWGGILGWTADPCTCRRGTAIWDNCASRGWDRTLGSEAGSQPGTPGIHL